MVLRCDLLFSYSIVPGEVCERRTTEILVGEERPEATPFDGYPKNPSCEVSWIHATWIPFYEAFPAHDEEPLEDDRGFG